MGTDNQTEGKEVENEQAKTIYRALNVVLGQRGNREGPVIDTNKLFTV